MLTPHGVSGRRRVLQTASLLFFLSGATGLAYQIVWFKRFSYVWGNSSLAMAAVVASFLGGLGAGAWLVGRLADRVRSPLAWYGVSEILIGLFALAIPFETGWVVELVSGLYGPLRAQPWLGFLARCAVTFGILGPPCLLMGGTFPLLVKEFTPPGSPLRRSTGWLYGINTLGAAAGCWATGFHVAPAAGLFWTNTGVAALNLAIGAAALVAASRPVRVTTNTPYPGGASSATGTASEALSESAGHVEPLPPAAPAIPWLLLTAALTGAAALILEMVWARQLALILGGSTYAFTAMLVLVLAGIGTGSLLFHLARERLAAQPHAAALIIAGLCLSTALGKWLIPEVTAVVAAVRTLRASPAMNAAVCAGASAVLELLPAIGMGLLFPLLVHLTRAGHGAAGRAVGAIYAFNTFGSIIGSALTSALLVPLLGTAGSVAFALALYLAALSILSPPLRGWRSSLAFFVLCVTAGTAAFVSLRRHDPRITNHGAYLYGPAGEAQRQSEVLMFREGRSCNVLVTRYGPAVSLRVNGKVDASNFGDMKMQVGSAYVPLFLAPGSREVLVIGFGSGSTAGAALLFPGVQVTCCEIEPAIVEASPHFHDVNHRPEESPRFAAIHDDGRSYLQGTGRRFDMVISEPSNPWMAGLSNLYSREYYEIVRSRLNPGGILAQWLQTYSFSPESYALVVRTILDAFPHAAFVRISDGDTLLLASDRPLAPSSGRVERSQELVEATPAIREDLERYFTMTDVRSVLLTHLLLDTGGLRRLVANDGGKTLNTDVNLRLEFDAPLQLFGTESTTGRVGRAIRDAARAAPFRSMARTLGCTAGHAGAFHKLAYLFEKDRNRDLVLELIDTGLELDPEHPELLADRLIVDPPRDAGELRSRLARIAATAESEANRVANAYLIEDEHELARTALELLAETWPSSATTWARLARADRALGRLDAAREAVAKALSLDPAHEAAVELRRELGPAE